MVSSSTPTESLSKSKRNERVDTDCTVSSYLSARLRTSSPHTHQHLLYRTPKCIEQRARMLNMRTCTKCLPALDEAHAVLQMPQHPEISHPPRFSVPDSLMQATIFQPLTSRHTHLNVLHWWNIHMDESARGFGVGLQ